MNSLRAYGAAILVLFGFLNAAYSEEKESEENNLTITPHGFAGLQSFRINKYKNTGKDYPSQVFNNSVLNFTFNLNSGPHLSIKAGMEGYVTFVTIPYDKIQSSATSEEAHPLWSWYMAEAQIAYSFGQEDAIYQGDVSIGLFPYKYNEDARNLGEYMFRSGTYPGWLVTNFDWTATRLTGLRFGSLLWNKWHNDILLTTEMEWYPFYDLSLSWISKLPVGNVLELGGGIQFARFLPAREVLTTPPIKGRTSTKAVTNFYTSGCDAENMNCDTSFYTFQGTKLMGSLSFDPKRFFIDEPSEDLFALGKEDGKLFAEVAVLGLENQGTIYPNVRKRMPMMIGFNIPTFNLMDVLSLQGEYYDTPYPNDYTNQIRFVSAGVPQPTKGSGNSGGTSPYTVEDPATNRPNFYAKHKWYWSLYGRVWVGKQKHLAIVGQLARDHWRTNIPYSNLRDNEEALSDPKKHWYSAIKIVSVW